MARSADDRFFDRITALEQGRTLEATAQQRIATGASLTGTGWYDPIDGDYGYRAVGKKAPRDIPRRTLEQARTDSIAAYRSNPMGRAIIDTYVAFGVGDSGLSLQCSSDEVRDVAESFWTDVRNQMITGSELMLRDYLIMGEQCQQMMVGQMTGVTRRAPLDVSRILDVELENGNPLWPSVLHVRRPGAPAMNETDPMTVISLDDISGLRQGEAFFWAGFKTLEMDSRGSPMLMPILDWLDSYDQVLANLIDRTALLRYLTWDVTIKGDEKDVAAWVKSRGSMQVPRSGSMEVHTDSVEMKPQTATVGSMEDVGTNQAVLTSIASGSGLSKTWLAEPDNANRATSLTMAEPVRRRVGSIQNEWISNLTEMARFAVDRAVAAGRIPMFVEIPASDGKTKTVTASETVSITGPSIAAADDKIAAEVMVQISQALTGFRDAGVMSAEAAGVAAKVAWEQFTGTPWRPEFDTAPVDTLADAIGDNPKRSPLTALAGQ